MRRRALVEKKARGKGGDRACRTEVRSMSTLENREELIKWAREDIIGTIPATSVSVPGILAVNGTFGISCRRLHKHSGCR
jgi:hypothetical protein